jgi:hypothetical protein
LGKDFRRTSQFAACAGLGPLTDELRHAAKEYRLGWLSHICLTSPVIVCLRNRSFEDRPRRGKYFSLYQLCNVLSGQSPLERI